MGLLANMATNCTKELLARRRRPKVLQDTGELVPWVPPENPPN